MPSSASASAEEPAASPRIDALALPPGVWRAGVADAAVVQPVCPTGYAALDAQLPGAGWPIAALTEFTAHAGSGELRLLAPMLAALTQAQQTVATIGAADVLYAPALDAAGIDCTRLLNIDARSPHDRLWAAETAIKSASLAAVLVWLPHGAARFEQMRRLALAAASAGSAVVVALRDAPAEFSQCAACLRLAVSPAVHGAISVRILKRRAAPLAQPIVLESALLGALVARGSPAGDRTDGAPDAAARPGAPRMAHLHAPHPGLSAAHQARAPGSSASLRPEDSGNAT